MKSLYVPNPRLDLVLERTVDVPPDLVWKAWTTPEHLMKWFCPLPWKTTKCRIDLRPGGEFFTRMEGPDGTGHDNVGCYLETVKNERLSWTSAMEAGFRPVAKPESGPGWLFTGAILLEPAGKGTKYTAMAIHSSEADAKQHRDMGFELGWGKALEQMVAEIKKW